MICTIPLSFLLAIWPLALGVQRAVGQYNSADLRGMAIRADTQSSTSRDIYIAGHDDFCLFGPAVLGAALSQGDRNVVSWCKKAGHNTRMIPAGTLKGVTYIKAKNWVQVSGVGDFSKINVKPGDWGGQFDSGDHKPVGARVMGGPDGKEASSWVSLLSPDTFCFRACFGDASYCPTTFAERGCYVLLSNGVGFEGTFQSCTSDDGLPPGKQGEHAPEWRDCKGGASAGAGGGRSSDAVTNKPNKASAVPSTSWVGVPTCIPCTGAPSSSAGRNPNSPSGVSETIQQGVTKLGSIVAGEKESEAPSSASKPKATSSGGNSDLVLKRAEETVTKDGQCCFTTWTPTIIGAATGPTSSSLSSSGSSKVGGMSSINPSNGTGTALITAPSDSAKPSGSAAVSGARNGSNETSGNGTSHASRGAMLGVECLGWGVSGVLLAAVGAAAGGWAVL